MAAVQAEKQIDFATSRHDWVYAARVCRLDLIKIGYSSKISGRIVGLKSQFRSNIEFLGVVPGGRELEQSIHASLGCAHFDGRPYSLELFYPMAEVMAFLRRQVLAPERVFSNAPTFISYTPSAITLYDLRIDAVQAACDTVAERTEQYGKSWYLNSLICTIQQAHKAGLDTEEARLLVEARFGIDIELPEPQRAEKYSPAWYRMTPQKVLFACNRILDSRKFEARHPRTNQYSLHYERRLIGRLRKDQANGFDIGPALAMVRMKLGDIAGLAGVAA